MSRRRIAAKRKIVPDPRYNSTLVTKFINKIMLDGKKSVAQNIFYQAMDELKSKTGADDVMEVFNKCINNVKPVLEVKSRRIGGATYQVPVEVSPDRRESLAIRWIVGYSRGRKGTTMGKALATELLDAYNNQGSSVKKKEDTHRMAEANKAFAHYRW